LATGDRQRKSEPTPAARALRLLARREHTRQELTHKLAPHVQDAAELQRVLDDCTARGWLSEMRAAEQLVRAKRGRFGAARIRQALTEKGVPHDLIASSLEVLKDSELETARAVWARKFKAGPATSAERARHVRFLHARGFSVEIALRVVRGAGSEDAGES
jgi:regulatory protein